MAPSAERPRNVPVAQSTLPVRHGKGKWLGLGLVLSLGTAVAVGWVLTHRSSTPSGPWNLLIITLDTTRADALGCYGNKNAETPNLDRLAKEGVRFARAYTCAPLTLPSHATLFTGTYPPYHHIHYNGTHSLSESAVTLAERLSEAGFNCGASVGAYVLHSQFGLGQGFAEYLDRFGADAGGEVERSARWVTDDAIRFLQRNGGKRFFLWVHYYDAHEPYSPPAPYLQRFAGRKYDGEIAYVDAQLGRLFTALESRGEADRTLTVVVADHGESLIQRDGRQGHGMFIYEETMRIPLILHRPGVLPRGKVVENAVSIVDVMPTVEALLDVPHSSAVQGSDLSPYISGRASEDRPLYLETFGPREVFGWSELRGVLHGDYKYVQAPKPELYHLAADPREKDNLIASQADRAAIMKTELDSMLARTSADGEATKAALSESDRARLAALGYVANETSGDDESERPDPKDMIDVAVAHSRAEQLQQTNPGAALAAYQEILARHPDDSSAHSSLGRLLMGQGRWDEAVDHFRRVLASRPDAVLTRRLLGFTLFQAGKNEEALRELEASLSINPNSNQSLFLKSLVLDAMGKTDEAATAVYESLRIDGAYDPARLHYGRLLIRAHRLDDALRVLEAVPENSTARYAAREEMVRIYESRSQQDDLQSVRRELAQLQAQGAPRAPAIIIAGGGY